MEEVLAKNSLRFKNYKSVPSYRQEAMTSSWSWDNLSFQIFVLMISPLITMMVTKLVKLTKDYIRNKKSSGHGRVAQHYVIIFRPLLTCTS